MTDTRNKADWGPGEWQDELDHDLWEAHGMPCMIHRGPSGALCGYVAVNPGHPAYEKPYSEVDARVHGGLTYSEFCQGDLCHVAKPGKPDNVWWLGFDCSHSGDLAPESEVYWRSKGPGYSMAQFQIYKNWAYVKHQTEQLAKQLAEMT